MSINKILSQWRGAVMMGLSLGLFPFQSIADVTSTSLTVSANIIATTCEMKLVGTNNSPTNITISSGTNDGGVFGADELAAGKVFTDFSLEIIECSSGATIKTSVTGTPLAEDNHYLKSPNSSPTSSTNVGASISRVSAPVSNFVINPVNDSDKILWTADEIASKKLALRVTLKDLLADGSVSQYTGTFSTQAVFSFEYQ